MSRSTQYIGLNDYATSFLDTLSAQAKFERIKIGTGMFGEPVYGAKYTVEHSEDPVNERSVYTKEVQDEPWSSGPMIFTCLRWQLVKREGQTLDMGRLYCWMVDPSVKKQEIDAATGAVLRLILRGCGETANTVALRATGDSLAGSSPATPTTTKEKQ